MNLSALSWLAAAALLLAAGASSPAPAQQAPRQGGIVVREQVVIRVQTQRAAPAPVQWKEGKGPKCVPARAILGASLLSQNSVDLILRDRKRVRARLERSCPALDYYYGFYITPNADGMICADRDTIRSRMGGQCEIETFKALEEVPRG